MFKGKASRVGREPRRSVNQPPERRREFFSYHASRPVAPEMRQQPARRQTLSVGRASSQDRQGEPRQGTILARLTHERIPVVLALLVLGISLLYMTTLSGTPRVIVSGSGTGFKPLRSIETYQKSANDILHSSFLNSNKLTINTTKVESELKKQFPEFQQVSIALPLVGHRPVIQATSERPALLLANQAGLYVVGSSGRILLKSSEALALPDLSTVQDDADLTIEPGRGILSSQDVEFITTIAQQFSRKDIEVTSMTLPALASELHVRISDKPYYIKFSLLTNPQQVAGQYFALMKKLDSEGTIPKEYVDSRVEERIFFK